MKIAALLALNAALLLFLARGVCAQAPELSRPASAPELSLSSYRTALDGFRKDFGGARELPDEKFFLFGMGLRTKLLYKAGALRNAASGAVIRQWDAAGEIILPHEYSVVLRVNGRGGATRIVEDESGVWIEESGKRELIPGTSARVRLPDFQEYKYAKVLRVLHQELLVNVMTNGPVPNFFVYSKPWYRDGAMMALAFHETGNLDCIRDWILGLREPYDRNNKGETEADNLGQALFLISLVSNTNHPLVAKVLAEVPRFEQQRDGIEFIKGRSDFAEHPVYQTKWLKFGLRALGLQDPYTNPKQKDGYSALFWMDYKDAYVPGDSNDRGNYPYLGWACDHFHGERKSPISNRDYPLTWEATASQANYAGTGLISEAYVKQKVSAPHTWHAAEVFLYLLEMKK